MAAEYRVLLNAVNSSNSSWVIGKRGSVVKLASDGDLLRLSLEPFSADRSRRGKISRLWPKELAVEVRRDARTLALMLENVGRPWMQRGEPLVGDSEGES